MYQQQPYHNWGYGSDGGFRPDDAPTTPPPQQTPSFPETFSSATVQPNQIRISMSYCLGRWGMLGLRRLGPFGRDFWFYPTEIRINSVSGYTWQGGRPRREDFNYWQIRNFMCFG